MPQHSYRPQCPVWRICFVYATEVSKGKKKPSLVVVLLSWSQRANQKDQGGSPLVLSLCAVVTRLPVCCCCYASGSSEGNRFTWRAQNKHATTEGFFVFGYLIGLEVLTTNPTRATQLEHTIISYQWIQTGSGRNPFCGTRSRRVMVGMLSCHENCLNPVPSLPLSKWSTACTAVTTHPQLSL